MQLEGLARGGTQIAVAPPGWEAMGGRRWVGGGLHVGRGE